LSFFFLFSLSFFFSLFSNKIVRANEAYSQNEKQRQVIQQLETSNTEVKGKLEVQTQKVLAVEREQQELGHQTTRQQSETSDLRANNAELLQKLSIQASNNFFSSREPTIQGK